MYTKLTHLCSNQQFPWRPSAQTWGKAWCSLLVALKHVLDSSSIVTIKKEETHTYSGLYMGSAWLQLWRLWDDISGITNVRTGKKQYLQIQWLSALSLITGTHKHKQCSYFLIEFLCSAMDKSFTLGNCNAKALILTPKVLQGTKQLHTVLVPVFPKTKLIFVYVLRTPRNYIL